MRAVLRIDRLRREDGFGLIELVCAMTMLTVGLLALFAAYSTGYVTLKRATRVSSANLLADSQMERFRALTYSAIQLNLTCGANCAQDATYTGDSAYTLSSQISGCSTQDATCLSTQTQTGPDGKSYRLDTYINWACATGTLSTSPSVSCSTGTNPVKLVTVVVRKSSGGVWVREQSLFNSLIGT